MPVSNLLYNHSHQAFAIVIGEEIQLLLEFNSPFPVKDKIVSLQLARVEYYSKHTMHQTGSGTTDSCIQWHVYVRWPFNVQLNRSPIPSHCRWFAVVFSFLMPNILHRFYIRCDKRLVPLSQFRKQCLRHSKQWSNFFNNQAN